MKRRVIIELPKGQSGLEVKMKNLRAGLGFNANVMPWPIMAGKMSEPNMQVKTTLSPVPRDEANLEAEKGEVAALPTKSGIPDTFKIGGKRHYEGGTPLNLPTDSFIFSDTSKMRIKDQVVLAQFGMPERKSGYTPAEIAKKYDVAPFKKILLDKNTDKLQKQTAELMIANYNLKLAKLALVQESMKGFPQGIPLIAMPYIESMQIDPAEFVQMNPGQGDAGAQQEEAGTTMAYGGDVDYFDNGGYKSEAEYKAHLLDPYSPEKAKAQLDWNMNKMYYTQPKNDEEKRKRLDYLQNSMGDIGFNPLEFYKKQQEAGQLFQELGESNPELVKKEIQTGQNAGKLMMAAGKYIFPEAAPAFNAIEGSMAAYDYGQNPNMHNTASLATEVAPFINNKYGTAYQLMGDYLTGQEIGLLSADKKAYGGMPTFKPGGGPNQQPPVYRADPALNNVVAYLREREAAQAKKSQYDAIYKKALANEYAKWEANKEAKKNAENAAANAARNNSIIRNELKRREAKIKRLTYELQTGKDANSPIGYPASPGAERKLRKELAEYQAYINKVNNIRPAGTEAVTADPIVYQPYKTQAEYNTHLLDPYSPEKRAAQIDWNKKNIRTLIPDEQDAAAEAAAKRIAKGKSAPVQKTSAEGTVKTAATTSTKPATTKYRVVQSNEDFGMGGTTGKKRVVIEYATGGQLPKAQYGDAGKAIKDEYDELNKSGTKQRHVIVYTDGTVSKGEPVAVVGSSEEEKIIKEKASSKPSTVVTKEQYDELMDLYKKGEEANAKNPGKFNPETLAFQKRYHDYLKEEAERIISTDPEKTTKGKQEGLLKYDVRSNQDGIFGRRTKQYFERLQELKPEDAKTDVAHTPPLKDETKPKEEVGPEGVIVSHGEPEKERKLPPVRPEWWLQDKIKALNAGLNYMGIKAYNPWEAQASYMTPRTTYLSPERALAENQSQMRTAMDSLAQFTKPQQFNARMNELYGKGLANAADIIGDVHNRNVQLFNQNALQEANIKNTEAKERAAGATSLWDKYQTVRQNFDAAKANARDVLANTVIQGITNRANTYNLNQMYPQYAIDPSTGGMLYFHDPRDFKPSQAAIPISQRYQQMMRDNPTLAKTEEGQKRLWEMTKIEAGMPADDYMAEYQRSRQRGADNQTPVPGYGS